MSDSAATDDATRLEAALDRIARALTTAPPPRAPAAPPHDGPAAADLDRIATRIDRLIAELRDLLRPA